MLQLPCTFSFLLSSLPLAKIIHSFWVTNSIYFNVSVYFEYFMKYWIWEFNIVWCSVSLKNYRFLSAILFHFRSFPPTPGRSLLPLQMSEEDVRKGPKFWVNGGAMLGLLGLYMQVVGGRPAFLWGLSPWEESSSVPGEHGPRLQVWLYQSRG